ncbi:MAG: hypothetical protein LBQ52_08020 [Helicobacteraceae bacterium]|jgi:hypothetical protein|nr:hypothetical protein [Helicobacteraceae bacterium]
MRIWIYKRTHIDDPEIDENGKLVFGKYDCMGEQRRNKAKCDAIIGIGAKYPDEGCEGIKDKITWVGLDPKSDDTRSVSNRCGAGLGCQSDDTRPEDSQTEKLIFDKGKFLLRNEDGVALAELAPNLAANAPRQKILDSEDANVDKTLLDEALKIIEWAKSEIQKNR